ncbi:MAG: hypothetical protein A4E73_01580 [Syntrophaceae bacterium PtaU1.Bin231]|nr:MAG: hypothetical protein A4E73_01580 [Syntrophaceae bacterium PtaU1.Bin231]
MPQERAILYDNLLSFVFLLLKSNPCSYRCHKRMRRDSRLHPVVSAALSRYKTSQARAQAADSTRMHHQHGDIPCLCNPHSRIPDAVRRFTREHENGIHVFQTIRHAGRPHREYSEVNAVCGGPLLIVPLQPCHASNNSYTHRTFLSPSASLLSGIPACRPQMQPHSRSANLGNAPLCRCRHCNHGRICTLLHLL